MAYGAGYLWADRALAEPRGADQSALARASVTSTAGHSPAGLAVAGGRVYVASTTDHTVVVIDPRTAQQTGRPLSVPFDPYAVAAGLGHVWVTSQAANSVSRLDLG